MWVSFLRLKGGGCTDRGFIWWDNYKRKFGGGLFGWLLGA
jgi:hypothetical protein